MAGDFRVPGFMRLTVLFCLCRSRHSVAPPLNCYNTLVDLALLVHLAHVSTRASTTSGTMVETLTSPAVTLTLPVDVLTSTADTLTFAADTLTSAVRCFDQPPHPHVCSVKLKPVQSSLSVTNDHVIY